MNGCSSTHLPGTRQQQQSTHRRGSSFLTTVEFPAMCQLKHLPPPPLRPCLPYHAKPLQHLTHTTGGKRASYSNDSYASKRTRHAAHAAFLIHNGLVSGVVRHSPPPPKMCSPLEARIRNILDSNDKKHTLFFFLPCACCPHNKGTT